MTLSLLSKSLKCTWCYTCIILKTFKALMTHVSFFFPPLQTHQNILNGKQVIYSHVGCHWQEKKTHKTKLIHKLNYVVKCFDLCHYFHYKKKEEKSINDLLLLPFNIRCCCHFYCNPIFPAFHPAVLICFRLLICCLSVIFIR